MRTAPGPWQILANYPFVNLVNLVNQRVPDRNIDE